MFDLKLLPDEPAIKFNRQLPWFNWHYPFDRGENWLANAAKPFEAARSAKVRRTALYIHIPFCDTICSFCVFRKDKYQSDANIQLYLEALVAEFDLKRRLIGPRKVDAIFVGGGTPSVLTPEQIGLLGQTLRRNFELQDLKEFTFEFEVKSITRDKLHAMRDIGVNRVSFGAQTFSPKYRTLFSLDAAIDKIEDAARLVNGMFPYTNVDILYGLAGQNEDELHSDAEAAMRLQTTTIDFYPINNLTAPRLMHRTIRQVGLSYLPATTRLQYRIHLDNLLRSRGYAPISGYSYSLTADTKNCAVVQHRPKFLYHDLVYGYHDDQIIGYGSSAISQMMGFNLYNTRDRHRYVTELLKNKTLACEAYGPIASAERGIVTFPFRGVLEKSRISWTGLPDETWIALQEAIQSELVIEQNDRYELSSSGWLFYVNLMYYLMPEQGKEWITSRIKKCQSEGRACGDTSLSELIGKGGNRSVEAWPASLAHRMRPPVDPETSRTLTPAPATAR